MATAAERRAARAKLKNNATADEAVPLTTLATEDAAPAPKRSRDVVTVGCKIPNGLTLKLYVLEDGFEPVFGGGSRPVKIARQVGDPIQINGSARAPGSDPDAKRVIGGYGLTNNVPKEAFEQWMRDNKDLTMVRNGLIFAHESPDRVADQAKDHRAVRSGLEALNTDGRKADGSYIDPRMPRNVKKFKADDDSTDISGSGFKAA